MKRVPSGPFVFFVGMLLLGNLASFAEEPISDPAPLDLPEPVALAAVDLPRGASPFLAGPAYVPASASAAPIAEKTYRIAPNPAAGTLVLLGLATAGLLIWRQRLTRRM